MSDEKVILRTPFSMLVVGPSGSGKSVFVNDLIQNRRALFDGEYSRVIWCYGIWQNFYETLPYEMLKGAPSEDLLQTGNMILVVDDMMDEAQDIMSAVFTKVSHHNNICCIFLTQNLFMKGKHSRTISLNAHYLILMKNTRDRAQISHLARQVYPHNSRFLTEVYNDATLTPYSYLLLDFKPQTAENMRVLTGILPSQQPFAYHPKV
jgi:ABC-type oligopeptide transport system ATPase subunit